MPPPAWLRAPHAAAGALQILRLREAGWSAAARSRRVLAPPALLAGALAHQRTVRGHRAAVYCIAFDRAGRRVMTGSDDRLVKASPHGFFMNPPCCDAGSDERLVKASLHGLFGNPACSDDCFDDRLVMASPNGLLSNPPCGIAPHADCASVEWAEEGVPCGGNLCLLLMAPQGSDILLPAFNS